VLHEKVMRGVSMGESVRVFLEVKTRHLKVRSDEAGRNTDGRTTLTSSSSESSLSWTRASRRSYAECFRTPWRRFEVIAGKSGTVVEEMRTEHMTSSAPS
jgi:hypothetical protein